MKKLYSIILFILFGVIFANDFNVYIDELYFLNPDNSTRVELSYKIPYSELQFKEYEGSYICFVDVYLSLWKNTKEVNNKTINHKIKVKPEQASSQSLNNKIIFDLNSSDISYKLKIKESWTEADFFSEGELDLLNESLYLSSIEFGGKILPTIEGNNSALIRDSLTYNNDASHVFDKTLVSKIYYYVELYNKPKDSLYDIFFSISKDGKVVEQNIFSEEDILDKDFLSGDISISESDEGRYSVSITALNSNTNEADTRESFFIVKETRHIRENVFSNLKDEIRLVSYISNLRNSKNSKRLKMLSDEAKWNFLDEYWRNSDLNRFTEENEFIELIKDRIAHSNKKFRSRVMGWKSDRGRIFIRNGEASSFDSGMTDPFETKHPTQHYEIWKYDKGNLIYLFVDTRNNGNLKLIYNKNDRGERIISNWKEFMGESFDVSRVE